MKNLLVFTFSVCFAILGTSLSFGQDVVWKGIVRDSITKEVLSDVRICLDQDMEGVLLDRAGEFQISVEKGTKVWFRKKGYQWKNIVITNNGEGIIELNPSSSKSFFSGLPGETEYYINDVKIPEEEWCDVKFTRDETESIRIDSRTGIMKFYYTTK